MNCSTATHTFNRLPDGRYWEYFFLNGRVVINQQIPTNRPTQTPPAEVLSNAGFCTLAPAPAPAPVAVVSAETAAAPIPFPLLAAGLVGATFAALNGIKQRAARRDLQAYSYQEKSAQGPDYGAEYTEPNPWESPTPALEPSTAPDVTWADAPTSDLPDLVEVRPHSERDGGGSRTGSGYAEPPVEPGLNHLGRTGSEPVQNHPALRHARHPLECCPLTFHEPITGLETDALTYCAYKGYSQNQAIETIWGVKKGGSKDYTRARERWQIFAREWASMKAELQVNGGRHNG